MIVKIWPIKADYANDKNKVGGVEGLKNAMDYITDAEKVIAESETIQSMQILDEEDILISDGATEEQNTKRVFTYVSNEAKIEGKYISGYLCSPENAVDQFNTARKETLTLLKRNEVNLGGAVAFHMVQSFPEGLSISDEEVHQCGIELCEKLNAYQAVICSHVHPTVDEEGVVHGKNKHNHILFNAYIHPSKLDPEKPDVAKYNDCKETYAQLRSWNDEIAIDHGLPIIRNPDDDRIYSWGEATAINKGLSWKQRVRLDIENARRRSTNWDEFVEQMEADGYKIKAGKYITYKTPDGKHSPRDNKLGQPYTKKNLMLYWEYRDKLNQDVQEELNNNDSPPLLDFVLTIPGPLKAAVPIGMRSKDPQNYYYLPLENAAQQENVLATYFNETELYDICDENNLTIRSATGKEIIQCMDRLRNGKQHAIQERNLYSNEPEDFWEKTLEKHNKEHYYTYLLFTNSRTKKPYRTSLFDQNGHRRSILQLMFMLAITVINKESGLWEPEHMTQEHMNEPIYAPKSWKIQNMIDSIYEAERENLETPAQLDARLNEAGAHLSRAKSALKKTSHARDKMQTLNETIKEYRKISKIALQILEMPDGEEKEQASEKYKSVLESYNSAKSVLYHYGITTEEEIADFEDRWKTINEDVKDLEERLDLAKEDYRRLKKLKYNMELSQNVQYCYGPAYTYDALQQMEEQRESDEGRNERAVQRVDDLLQKSSVTIEEQDMEPEETKQKVKT